MPTAKLPDTLDVTTILRFDAMTVRAEATKGTKIIEKFGEEEVTSLFDVDSRPHNRFTISGTPASRKQINLHLFEVANPTLSRDQMRSITQLVNLCGSH